MKLITRKNFLNQSIYSKTYRTLSEISLSNSLFFDLISGPEEFFFKDYELLHIYIARMGWLRGHPCKFCEHDLEMKTS